MNLSDIKISRRSISQIYSKQEKRMCGWPVLTLRMPSSQFFCTSHTRNISSFGGFKTFTNSWYAKWLLRCNADFSVFRHFRNQDRISVIFVDDSYLQGDTKYGCTNNTNAKRDLLSSLGFSIHTGKSVLIPTQKILGFLIASKNMKISLTHKKAKHLTLKIKKFLVNKSPDTR